MPNAPVQAAGEAMPTVTLESMLDRYLSAKAAMDAGKSPQGSANEAEFHAALEALNETYVKPSTYDGAVKALHVAIKEAHDADAPEMVLNLLVGVQATLKEREEEHPWVKARRLLKELSSHLEHCDDGKWTAYVMPPVPQSWNGFGAFPKGQKPDDLPVDGVERLSWELSEALKDYQGGSFQAMVLPSNVGGHTVMLTKISAFDRRAKA